MINEKGELNIFSDFYLLKFSNFKLEKEIWIVE